GGGGGGRGGRQRAGAAEVVPGVLRGRCGAARDRGIWGRAWRRRRFHGSVARRPAAPDAGSPGPGAGCAQPALAPPADPAQPRRRRETVTAWAFLAPSMLHLAVFSFAPILFAFYLAMHRWSPVEPVRPFVGVVNFTRMLHDPLVGISLRNTLLYVLYVPVSAAIALGVALPLSRSTCCARVVRTMFFLPYVSSVVPVTLVVQQ